MAALPIETYIASMCPLLNARPDRAVFIELATDRIDPTYFGDKFTNYAIALRAMHDFTLFSTRLRGESGFVTDLTEGRVTKRFLHNMSRPSRNDLPMTVYGQALHALIRSLGPIISVGVVATDEIAGMIIDTEDLY